MSLSLLLCCRRASSSDAFRAAASRLSAASRRASSSDAFRAVASFRAFSSAVCFSAARRSASRDATSAPQLFGRAPTSTESASADDTTSGTPKDK